MPSNNPKPTFNIFGPATRCDIRVGYISTTRGYVDNVNVYEANKHAKLDPGTTFIFKTRDVIRYLNINEVNNLTSTSLLPSNWGETCKGPQLNIIPKTPQVYFYGGGGVGATANPIIGRDGSLMAVHVVEGGYGYQYPPEVRIRDDLDIGAGTILKSKLCKKVKTYIVYDSEKDFEEYDLTSCRGEDLDDYGVRYGLDGKPIGRWDPTIYANLSGDPIRAEIRSYQEYLARGLNPWWTTRKDVPLSITSEISTKRTSWDVTHRGWSPWLNENAISPVSPSNVPGSDYAGMMFTFVWEENFPYDGEYVFKAMRDNTAKVYLDNVLIWDLKTSGFSHVRQRGYVDWHPGLGWGITPFTKKKNIKAGVHRIRVDLSNLPVKEKVIIQPPLETHDVTFKITSSARYSNGINIPELGIQQIKSFDGPQINETYIRTVEPGKKYDVILTSPESKPEHGGLRLRTQGDTILQMEEAKDGDWKDIEVSVSQGRFLNIPPGGGRRATCQFILDKVPPPKVVDPSTAVSQGIITESIFNTVDWIGRANRQLWRTNVYGRGGFLGTNGVCPFNTMQLLNDNPYAGSHRIVWNSIKIPFPGNYAIEVEVDDNVNLQFRREGKDEINIRKEGFVNNDATKPTGKSTYVRHFEKGVYNLIADLEQIPDGRFGFGGNLGVGGGSSANVKAKFIKKGSDFYVDVKGNGSAQITFTAKASDTSRSGYAATEIQIESDHGKVKLKRNLSKEKENITATGNFSSGKRYKINVIGGSTRGKGRHLRSDKKIEMFDAGGDGFDFELRLSKVSNAVVNSIKGLNPMALAINVRSAYIIEEVISPKSWQQNPMGLALTIDAPMPPIPQEPIINQEGRCPRNPTWTTRFPGAKQQWWPVNGDLRWSKFQNRHAISPVPPLSTLDSDQGGTMFTNSWPLVIDYDGYYGVRGTRDDVGEVLIDGQLISKLDNYKIEDPKTSKVYLKKGDHTIEVRVGNKRTDAYKWIDRKVFSTGDWAVKQTLTQESGIVDVTFNVSSNAQYANSIEIIGLFKEAKQYNGPQIKKTHTLPVEFGKVYEVVFHSVQAQVERGGVRLRTKGENVIQMEESSDMDWVDIVCSASRGKFFDLGRSTGGGGNEYKVNYSGLNASNKVIKVTNNGKRLELKDGKGDDVNASFNIESGKAVFTSDGRKITGKGKIKINLSWDDNPKKYKVAVKSISILDVTWRQDGTSGSETKTVDLREGNTGSPTNRAKFVVDPKVIRTGGSLVSGTSKEGITYTGPELASYRKEALGPSLTPAWEDDFHYRREFMGRGWTSIWSGVEFPSDGIYTLKCLADDWLRIYVDDVEIGNPPDFAAEVYEGVREYKFRASSGIHNIKMEYYNIPGNNRNNFETNPVAFSAIITDKISVTSGHSKPWTENPTGISAVLLPPPCPREVGGRGVVCDVEILDPGNGYPIDITPVDIPTYPVSLDLTDILVSEPGINYDCTKDRIVIEPSNGAEAVPICGGFGQITGVTIITPGTGFVEWPKISIQSPTGSGFVAIPKFTPISDPLPEPEPDKLIQVTDLVGIKQTGYYDGRPYYGAVFYKDGIRYAGYYETAGQFIQIYDTLQESIDARVTTPPSAIERSGTDISSNDPRLNIPGTPDNLI